MNTLILLAATLICHDPTQAQLDQAQANLAAAIQLRDELRAEVQRRKTVQLQIGIGYGYGYGYGYYPTYPPAYYGGTIYRYNWEHPHLRPKPITPFPPAWYYPR